MEDQNRALESSEGQAASIQAELSGHTGRADARHGLGHVVPVRLLAGVLATLLVLTFLTVAATWGSFGSFNIWIALLIATIKAALVALYFMHLRYDRPFNGVVLITTLFFVALFIGIALQDVFQYRESIDSYRADDPARFAPLLRNEPPIPEPPK